MVPPDQSSETDPMVAIFSDGSTKSVMQTTVKKWMAEFGDSATLRRPAAAAAAARAAAPTGAAAAATTPELFVGYMDTEKIDVHFRWDAPGGRKIRYICLRHAGQGQIVQLNVEAFAADGESIAVSSQRSKLEKLAAEWMNPIAKKYAEGTLDKEGVCNKKKEDFPQTQMKRRPAAAVQKRPATKPSSPAPETPKTPPPKSRRSDDKEVPQPWEPEDVPDAGKRPRLSPPPSPTM
eukprot:8719216-Pyramimonas_sp.AAC.2